MPLTISGKYFRLAVAGFVSASVLVWPAIGADTIGADSATPIPDFSGLWARPYIGFEPPASGPGPIVNRSRVLGQSNINQFVGDYTSPILKPQAAEMVKKHGELELKGLVAPNPSNQCLPMSPPYILQRQEVQMLQQKNRVTILYNEDQQVRRVRLNAKHPARVTLSWMGDSVGHYEGDTLVIDTIGIKVGPYSMVDSYGTPHSEALHVIERYRLIDYQAAEAAAQKSERENRRLAADNSLGNGVGIDPDYRGKALQGEFTVEDANVFTTPWSGTTTYWRGSGDWVERVCAEETHEYYAGLNTAIPTAQKPDF
jgi:hypothetical protein